MKGIATAAAKAVVTTRFHGREVGEDQTHQHPGRVQDPLIGAAEPANDRSPSWSQPRLSAALLSSALHRRAPGPGAGGA